MATKKKAAPVEVSEDKTEDLEAEIVELKATLDHYLIENMSLKASVAILEDQLAFYRRKAR